MDLADGSMHAWCHAWGSSKGLCIKTQDCILHRHCTHPAQPSAATHASNHGVEFSCMLFGVWHVRAEDVPSIKCQLRVFSGPGQTGSSYLFTSASWSEGDDTTCTSRIIPAATARSSASVRLACVCTGGYPGHVELWKAYLLNAQCGTNLWLCQRSVI